MKLSIISCSLCLLLLLCTYEQNFGQKTVKNLMGKEVAVGSIDSFLETTMKKLQVPGASLVLINDGKVVYKTSKGFADIERQIKVTSKTIFEGASLSKPLFAYFAMMDVEQGLLDLDTPLFRYLPYNDIAHDERYKKITARMVLSHTSGFPNWRSDSGGVKLKIKFAPGTSFEYSGEGYQYLAKVLAHIHNTNDKGLEALFQKRVAQPLQMKFTKYIQDNYNVQNKAQPYDKGKRIKGEEVNNEFGSAYSIHTNVEDFSKWVLTLLEEKGLSQSSYKELFKPQVILPENSRHRQQGVVHWTLGFAEAHMPFGAVYGHGGNNPGYTSLFTINREKKWAFIMFTNANQSMLALQTLLFLNNGK
ncbi:hypothetical protein BKI52_20285 [marine bacterium AO1-C]|nr:hypothetical protein BKI52_20285 [marine bacterium AO1-C]